MPPLRQTLAVTGFFLLVAIPALVQMAGLDPDRGAAENRILASAPRLDDFADLPRATDAWLRDHFGLRRALVAFANRVRFDLFHESGNPQLAFGRHGQLFFTAHDAAKPQQMLLFLCQGGANAADNHASAASLASFLDDALRRNRHVVDLIVPTKTIIDARDLPGWMRARCADGHPLLPALLASLDAARPDLRARVDYPLALMEGLHGVDTPYPKFNFHWDGPALGIVAASVAEDRFGRRRLATLPQRTQRKPSDIAHLLPGVTMEFTTREPDLAAAGVAASDEIPELGLSGRILFDVSRYTRPGSAGPRLLIISDSFGQAIAPWFAAYYGEVWHIAVNNLAQFTPAARAVLLEQLFHGFRPDDLLLVFHDFSQGYLNQELRLRLWQEQGAPSGAFPHGPADHVEHLAPPPGTQLKAQP